MNEWSLQLGNNVVDLEVKTGSFEYAAHIAQCVQHFIDEGVMNMKNTCNFNLAIASEKWSRSNNDYVLQLELIIAPKDLEVVAQKIRRFYNDLCSERKVVEYTVLHGNLYVVERDEYGDSVQKVSNATWGARAMPKHLWPDELRAG